MTIYVLILLSTFYYSDNYAVHSIDGFHSLEACQRVGSEAQKLADPSKLKFVCVAKNG